MADWEVHKSACDAMKKGEMLEKNGKILKNSSTKTFKKCRSKIERKRDRHGDRDKDRNQQSNRERERK